MTLKNRLIFAAVLFVISFYNQVNGQVKYTINESWHFIKDNSIQNINQFNLQKDETEIIDIPHTWNVEDVMDEEEGFYRGAGWYTKELRIPTSYAEKEIFILFEGVATAATVYINNKPVKTHIGGFTRFVVPVSDHIKFNNDNDFTTFNITVKADNSYNEDWPALKADFTFFGGMYRDVNLIVTEKVHFNIEDDAANGVFITTPNVSAKSGDVHLKMHLKNDESVTKKINVKVKLYDPKQALIREKVVSLKMKSGVSKVLNLNLEPVLSPQLWSPDAPNLYKIVCEIYNAETNKKLDVSSNTLGFRWFKFDTDKGFFLNGKHLKLIGTNRHQDYEGLSNAVPDHVHVEDVLLMKNMGSNFLRIAHYPQDSAILELCDRLGIITTIETPVIDTITESKLFTENCLSAQLEMIRQNYNHPSLIIWAYMNEILLHPPYKSGTKAYEKYTKSLFNLAQKIENLTRTEDPYRYTMIPNHNGVERYKNAGLTDIPMLIGCNIYLGWYGGSYKLMPERIAYTKTLVNKPIIITEYGAGVDSRLHTLNPTRFDFTQEYGTEHHKFYLEYINKNDFIAGANVWNYADFNSEKRVDAVQSINNKGLVSLDRTPKDVFYYYQAALLKEPFLAIATKTWGQRTMVEDKQGRGIATMPVQIFSNQDEIELKLNGKSLGVKTVKDKIVVFNVPFVNGVNKLVAKSTNQTYLEDFSSIRVNVLPISLEKFPASGISVNVGDQRFFYDNKIKQAWMFDRAYTKGSWGHVGGKPYVRPSKRKQQPYGAKKTIKGTKNDPIYQTQLKGIEQYRFDVPDGVYEVKLHFAELEGTAAKHLPYDLNEDETISQDKGVVNRTFSVTVNGKMILNKIDLLGDYGEYRAVKIKTEISVQNGEFLIIDFKKNIGKPVLNAIEVYKKL